MADPLIEAAPGFDQPIAMLNHCHGRIRKQLTTLQRLLAHLLQSEPDLDIRQASDAVVRYFSTAARHHQADEEEDLLPMLHSTAKGEDAVLLVELAPQILREHQQMDAAWQVLDQQLKRISAGVSSDLSEQDVKHFAGIYAAHMEREETHIAPMAMRILSTEQMTQLGDAMRKRRGIA